VLAVKVANSDPNRIDRALARLLTAPRPSTAFRVSADLSAGGSTAFVVVAAAVLAVAAWWRWRDVRLVALCLLAPAAAGLLELATKHAVGVRRPVSADLWGARRFGFPSGHATGAAALATLVVLLVIHSELPRRRQAVWIVVAIAFALTVSVSRIVVDDHLAMDAVGGILLGVGTVATVGAVVLAPYPMRLARRRRYRASGPTV
jgi:membrane-associated phospholipid phosphatase